MYYRNLIKNVIRIKTLKTLNNNKKFNIKKNFNIYYRIKKTAFSKTFW